MFLKSKVGMLRLTFNQTSTFTINLNDMISMVAISMAATLMAGSKSQNNNKDPKQRKCVCGETTTTSIVPTSYLPSDLKAG